MGKHTQQQVKIYLKWLAPGLLIKRWMFLSLAGVLLTILGLAIWINLTPIYRLIELTSTLISNLAKFFPSYISGPLAIVTGLLFIFWGQSRTIKTISDVFEIDQESELVDMLRNHSRSTRLNQGVRLVTIGGGTGLSTLLRGLKHFSSNITAVVTVADDGGSSGRLRREIGVLPPGDIRNCIAALADEEKLLTELFQYRFMAGNGLIGHSFGNLFLTAMTEITGDLERAIAASSKVLAIEGRVLPATLSDMHLWAEMDDGRRVDGESHISEDGGKIKTIGCQPSNPPALPAVLSAIDQAELIIMGPGSLYTSVIPNLLVPEIREAILARQAPAIYVCNIMTQPGETDGYTVGDHIAAIDQACGNQQLFDAVLVNEHTPSAQALIRYSKENSHPVYIDRERIRELNRQVVIADIMHEDENTGFVRHDHHKLSKALINWYEKSRSSLF